MTGIGLWIGAGWAVFLYTPSMAASMYIVVEGEDPGFDTYVNGRALAREEAAMERLAHTLGGRPLLDFFSADENSMALLIQEGAGNPDLLDRLPPTQWFQPTDGLATLRELIIALQMEPRRIGKESANVLSELLEYACVLGKAEERKLRWHLAFSWR